MPRTCLVPQGGGFGAGDRDAERGNARAIRLGELAAEALNRALATLSEDELDALEARLTEFLGLAEAG